MTFGMEVSLLRRPARSPAVLRLREDPELVALARAGQPGAFDALVLRYRARLLRFCTRMVGSPEEAEDLLQEVFFAAHRAMLADQRPIEVRPWLYRIARNRCLTHLRRPPAPAAVAEDAPEAAGISAAEAAERRAELRRVLADVTALPTAQRSALLLREVDELSHVEIARTLGTTVPGVKSLLVRARMSLAASAQSRSLPCFEVRSTLARAREAGERPAPAVRRHARRCTACGDWAAAGSSARRAHLLAGPLGPLLGLRELVAAKLGWGGGAAGTAAVASGAGVAGTAAVGAKAAAGLAVAVLATSGGVAAERAVHPAASVPRASAEVSRAPAESVGGPARAARAGLGAGAVGDVPGPTGPAGAGAGEGGAVAPASIPDIEAGAAVAQTAAPADPAAAIREPPAPVTVADAPEAIRPGSSARRRRASDRARARARTGSRGRPELARRGATVRAGRSPGAKRFSPGSRAPGERPAEAGPRAQTTRREAPPEQGSASQRRRPRAMLRTRVERGSAGAGATTVARATVRAQRSRAGTSPATGARGETRSQRAGAGISPATAPRARWAARPGQDLPPSRASATAARRPGAGRGTAGASPSTGVRG